MKHRQLQSIAHNFVDSLASGLGFLVGYYPIDIFVEAAEQPRRVLTIDFLNGELAEGQPSENLLRAISLFKADLPGFCERNGASLSDFRELSARFTAGGTKGAPHWDNRFSVKIIDSKGRNSELTYEGTPGRRVVVLDALGRRRAMLG